MSQANKAILERANAAITQGDHDGFLSFCADDVVWTMVGGTTLTGKAAVRRWMQEEYVAPPKFTVATLIADGDFVVACGDIMAKDEAGRTVPHAYCDVWRFRDGKMAELRAFVVATPATDDSQAITLEAYRELSKESHDASNNGNF